MKVSCALSALALLPASLAFAPGSSKTPLRTKSSLNGFLADIFADRVESAIDEKKRMLERFGTSLKKGVVGEFISPTKEEEAKIYRNKAPGNFDYMPTEEMTGVTVHLARLCATMAKQCYQIRDGDRDSFLLSTKENEAEALWLEEQGVFNPTSPTFGACVTGETMILAWRGTDFEKAPTDLINDAAWSPCASVVWRKHAKTVKLFGSMASLANNDLANYEERIIAECKERGIKEIITTGHSLGGGIGQCAHTIIRAQMQDETSPWNELEGVNVRSVVFSAPMTTLLLDDYTEETEKFVDEIDDNSCNIILSNDVVPRGYGYLSFINDFVDDVIDDLGPYVAGATPLPSFVAKRLVDKIEAAASEKLANSDIFSSLIDVLSQYIHPGKIVYYEDSTAKPRVLKDMGAFDKNSGKKDTFRSVKYKADRKVKAIEDWADWHNDILPGLRFDDSVLH